MSDLQSGNSEITKEACARRIKARVKAADTEQEQVKEMADRLWTKSAQTGTILEGEQAEEESMTVEKYDLICQIMGEHGRRSKRKGRRHGRLNKMAATWGNMRGCLRKSDKKKGGREGHSEARKAKARAAPCTCKGHRC